MATKLDDTTLAWHNSIVQQKLAVIRAAYQHAKAALEELGKLIERQTQEAGSPKVKVTKRELCTTILRECGPLDVYQLLREMEIRGYTTTGKNPVGSLRSFLYQAGGFECEDSIFRLPNQTIPGGKRLTRRQACTAILAERGPLDINAILLEMRRRGYRLSGANPKNAIRSFLYHNDKVFAWKQKKFFLKAQDSTPTSSPPPEEVTQQRNP